MDRFVARVNALAPHGNVPLATRAWVLTEVRSIAERIDPTGCAGVPTGYARCLIHEDPSGWSLAAIILQPGQATPAHDHGGWGGAVVVRGLERDRRFAPGAAADPTLVAERDYPPGTGYLFSPDDVHQPVGADPDGPTVSLHFLAHASHDRPQHRHEHGQAGQPTTEVAAMADC